MCWGAAPAGWRDWGQGRSHPSWGFTALPPPQGDTALSSAKAVSLTFCFWEADWELPTGKGPACRWLPWTNYLGAVARKPQGLTGPTDGERVVFHLFTQKLISAQMRVFNQAAFPSVSAASKSQTFFVLIELEKRILEMGKNALSMKLSLQRS